MGTGWISRAPGSSTGAEAKTADGDDQLDDGVVFFAASTPAAANFALRLAAAILSCSTDPANALWSPWSRLFSRSAELRLSVVLARRLISAVRTRFLCITNAPVV